LANATYEFGMNISHYRQDYYRVLPHFLQSIVVTEEQKIN